MLAGSLGMLPSASLGERRTAHGLHGLYEPIHGSAPDIAGQRPGQPDRHDPVRRRCCCAGRSGEADAADAIEAAVGAGARRRLPDRRPRGRPTATAGRTGRTAGDRRRGDARRSSQRIAGRRPAPRGRVGRLADAGRPLRHDPARRHPGRGHHPLAGRQAQDRPPMLDEYGMPYIEGGWPGSNPKDVEFFAAARTIDLAARRGSPPSAPPATAPTGPRTTRTCRRSSRPRRRSSRSSARAGCST